MRLSDPPEPAVDPCEQLFDTRSHDIHGKDGRRKHQPVEQQVIVGDTVLREQMCHSLHAVPADERMAEVHAIGIPAAVCQKAACGGIGRPSLLDAQERCCKPVCGQAGNGWQCGEYIRRWRIHVQADTDPGECDEQGCGQRGRHLCSLFPEKQQDAKAETRELVRK